jgi:hypothetical protein
VPVLHSLHLTLDCRPHFPEFAGFLALVPCVWSLPGSLFFDTQPAIPEIVPAYPPECKQGRCTVHCCFDSWLHLCQEGVEGEQSVVAGRGKGEERAGFRNMRALADSRRSELEGGSGGRPPQVVISRGVHDYP